MSEDADLKAERALQHREYVLQEFVDSEREYVGRLHVAVEDYLHFIRSGGPEVPLELKTDTLAIFSTLPEIYAFHRDVFLPSLIECRGNPQELVACFPKHSAQFKLYVPYCKNKLNSDTVRSEYEEFFATRHASLGHKLNIDDLLIAPVQRLPKYQLLIRDLYKDTIKANLDATKIEESLAVMKKIPKETNNIICMSLLRGIPRASIVSHGSLWRQDSILYCEKGSREEVRHVFLFDHRILIATVADKDSFFDYQTSFKMLNGQVIQSVDSDSAKFGFTEESGVTYYFKASSSSARDEWVADINSILTSQAQMKKALVFGRRLSPNVPRVTSVALDWSDSDSSIDSLPDSESDHEQYEDWPTHTGFHSFHEAPPMVSVTSSPAHRRVTVAAATSFNPSLVNRRPRSKTLAVAAIFPVSPRLLKRVFTRKSAAVKHSFRVSFPSVALSRLSLRSPGAFPKNASQKLLELQPEFSLLIAVDDLPAIAEQLYKPFPGQVVVAEDSSKSEVWRVRVVTGVESGTKVWVQTNCFEQYSAEVNTDPVKKMYSTISELKRGRFAELKLVKCKASKQRFVIKQFSPGQSEEHFTRELCIAVRLRHKNLVRAILGFQNKEMAICMEYVNGRPLLEHLTHKARITESNVCDLMAQLLQALHYLHSHTILHLDIRHHNIMVDLASGRELIKLLDFGAARHFGSGGEDTLYSNHEVSFDYQYVAPEVFKHMPVHTGTDMWGVGIIVFTIFHGNTPFHGDSHVRTIANVTAAQYEVPRPPVCSVEALQLLQSIFVPTARDRPSAEQALNSSWITESRRFHDNTVNLIQLKEFLLDH